MSENQFCYRRKVYCGSPGHFDIKLDWPHDEKIGFSPMRIQRCRSAVLLHCTADQGLCFRYTDSTIPLLPKPEISSF